MARLARRWRWWVYPTLLIGALAALSSLWIERRYRATAELAVVSPETVQGGGQLSNLAGALGIQLGGQSSSLELFARYARSRDLVDPILERPLPLLDGESTTILERWGGGGEASTRRERAAHRFGRRLQVQTEEAAGTLRLTVDLFDPLAAAAVANDYVQRLNAFDAELRRWSAANQSEFLQQRGSEILHDLRAAEDSLTAFRMANRVLSHPRLQLEEMRHVREVAIQSELLETVRVQQELSELEAKRDAPVLKTIESARAPSKPIWPRPLRLASIAMLAALLSSGYLVAAFGRPR